MKKSSIFNLSVVVLLAATATVLSISSCNKEEKIVTPAPPGNEFLTTVIVTCTNDANSGDVVTGTWRDLTPDDLNPPDTSMAILNLKKNSTYHVTIKLLDETTTPAGVISDDILARGNYHLFCFNVSSSLGGNLTVTKTDHDTNNPPLPIGLQDDFTTLTASNGVLNILLRHQPNVKDGSCDPGSTDLDVNFQVNIQ